MSVGSGQDGGYLVPPETETEIGRLISKASPFRDICDVRQISAMVHNKPFNTNGHRLGWIGETANAPANHIGHAGPAHLSDDGTLCHAGGHPGAA